MATASEYVSQEVLDQVSTESFAQNLSNFRSLLLKWEKEVEAGAAQGARARTMLREAAMLQEIVQGQMNAKGRDLGVPPEEVANVLTIYKRAFQKLLLWTASDVNLFSSQMNHLIEVIDGLEGAPSELASLAAKVKLARSAYQTLLISPEAASLIAPSFITMLNDIAAASQGAGVKVVASSPPPSPPATPPQGGGGGDSGSDIPRRVGVLESKMDKVTEDLSSIKATLGRIEETLKHSAMKSDVARIDERLSHMPTKVEMYVAGGTAFAGLFAVISKAFKWW